MSRRAKERLCCSGWGNGLWRMRVPGRLVALSLVPLLRRGCKQRLAGQEVPQLKQRRNGHPRMRPLHEGLAECLVEHPRGHRDLQPALPELHDHAVRRVASEAANDLYLFTAERMESVTDRRKHRFMGSMMMGSGTRTPLTSWRPARTCGPCRPCSATRA